MDKTTDTEALKALVAHRIPAALKRITDGHGLMRVPAEDTDPDLVLADCKIALERMLASQGAPPLAEPDVEAMAKEITQLFVGLDGFPGISASAGQDLEIKVEHAIRKHLRPTQQTEGVSAAPQAEGK